MVRKPSRATARESGDKSGRRIRALAAPVRKSTDERGIAVAHLVAAKRLADLLGLDAARRALEVLAKLAS
jgi:hypothetical protein